MKPRFQPDRNDVERAASALTDAESYDASEQRFAASLEKPPQPRFVVDEAEPQSTVEVAWVQPPKPARNAEAPSEVEGEAPQSKGFVVDEVEAQPAVDLAWGQPPKPARNAEAPSEVEGEAPQSANSWRSEVARRVNKYRARRRPRAPRYPSLQLQFEMPEASAGTAEVSNRVPAISGQLAVVMQDSAPAAATPSADQPVAPEVSEPDFNEPGARILEFPHPTTSLVDELAEPVLDRLRILEVPEQVPAPPALGGILIEPEQPAPRERRPGFELPLQAAPMSRRMTAVLIDGFSVAAAFAIFAFIFFRLTSTVPPLFRALPSAAIVIGFLWFGYQYLLLTYTATTPGLKLAKLELSRFDGRAVPRKLRRWRVLASMLSGMSLALGYAWCFLDEDQLCWHDRITRTYMAPKSN